MQTHPLVSSRCQRCRRRYSKRPTTIDQPWERSPSRPRNSVTCGCFRRLFMLEPIVSALLRLERLIVDRDLRRVYTNPCLVAGETFSAALGERCWFECGAIVYMMRNMRDKVVWIFKRGPFKRMCDHSRSSKCFRRTIIWLMH